MTTLLNDRLAPITSEFGFVEADIDRVSEWHERWQVEPSKQRGGLVERSRLSGSLEDMLHRLEPLEPLTGVLPVRFLFVATQGNWTAYFDNGHQGSDATSLDFLAGQMDCRAVRLVSIADTLGTGPPKDTLGRFGATIFELYGPKPENLGNVRSVAVANDGGKWKFVQVGEPLPFEDLAAYKLRSIRERFNVHALERCLSGLGISAFDQQFYSSNGVLLEHVGTSVPGQREYSLDEARTRLGLAQQTSSEGEADHKLRS